MTKQEILDILKERNIRHIKLQFSDMNGNLNSIEIPASSIERALDNKVMFDGSSVNGFTKISSADLYLAPDLDTYLELKFEETELGRVARFLCDIKLPTGESFSGCPRHILRDNLKIMSEMGFSSVNVGFEPEFFLFRHADLKDISSLSDTSGYFDANPDDNGQLVRREIITILEELGYTIEASHHEVAVSQNEICTKFLTNMAAADYLQTFKYVVKWVAHKYGYIASFMPKPFRNQNGNGMHTNISLSKIGVGNAFYDVTSEYELSDIARKFINGILKYAPEFTAITNPTINSYKRLVPGYEAPCLIAWSTGNRSSLIRIPMIRGNSTRVEIRSVDPTSNPYLVISVVLNAGLKGIEESLDLIPPVTDNLFKVTKDELKARNIKYLPRSLETALENLKNSSLVKEAIGDHTFHEFYNYKSNEVEEYNRVITQWEIDKYLKK